MPPLMSAPVSGRYLSFAEREEIALLHAQDVGVREIGRRLRRDPSTISRELRRNASTRSNELTYRATTAQWHAERRASRPKVAKLVVHEPLRNYVQDRLAGEIARPDGALVAGPEVRFVGRRHGRRTTVAGRSRGARNRSRTVSGSISPMMSPCASPTRPSIRRSSSRAGRAQARAGACLRTGRALRVPRARTRGRGKKFVTPEIMISERPAEAEDRAVPGHWEGDLILGLNRSAIGTLVERTTRFTMLLRLPPMEGHGSSLASRTVRRSPVTAPRRSASASSRRSGAARTAPTVADVGPGRGDGPRTRSCASRPDSPIYFCDPQSPWQRGTNENTNGLLRQYFPKGTDLARHSREDLDAVAPPSTRRPRKTLELEDTRRSTRPTPSLCLKQQCCFDPLNLGSSLGSSTHTECPIPARYANA